MPAIRLSARWVLPMVVPPIEGGAVLVGEDGRIAAVGRDAEVPRPSEVEEWQLGDAVLMPGLVNTHAHLELTALRGLVRDRPFSRWIASVRGIKEALTAADFRASARWGVLESFAAGITTTGDTGSSGEAAIALAELGARGVAYQEVFGPDPAQCEAALAELERALDRLWPFTSARVEVGVSPHAPYTVSTVLLRNVAAFARARGCKVAMHVAESPDESLFVERGEGPFAEALRARGIVVGPQQCSPVAWVARSGLMELRPLLIHCVTAGEEDFRYLARHGAAVAHCPWSNAVLGHGRADLALMRTLKVTVGLGTDSVTAGGGVDLFHEARVAAVGTDLTPRELLRLVTMDGAAALGLDGLGMLVPSAWGDLVAVSLGAPALAGAADPEEALALSATAADVHHAWVAGRMVYQRGFWPGVDAPLERAALERAAKNARAARG
ncbi:MAG: amidohydrolase family protein [Gemmatimonadales bacterium]|nr:amidohydrolase family protein [Gemmatimonadales bacterium]